MAATVGRLTGIYFFSTQMGKGAVDERHARCLGTAALSDQDYHHCAIERADLIINVGHDVSEKPPFIMRENGQKVIHISFFPAEMDYVYFPQHEVIGCTATNTRMLADASKPSASWDFDYFERVRAEIETHVFAEKANERYCDRGGWLDASRRIEILERLASLVDAQADALARHAALEGGKPLKDSIVEIEHAIDGVKVAIAEISRLHGTEITMGVATLRRAQAVRYDLRAHGFAQSTGRRARVAGGDLWPGRCAVHLRRPRRGDRSGERARPVLPSVDLHT